jgi:hypothetical protein
MDGGARKKGSVGERGCFAAGRAQDLHNGTDTATATAPCVVSELLVAGRRWGGFWRCAQRAGVAFKVACKPRQE